jgi:hypothetical protein
MLLRVGLLVVGGGGGLGLRGVEGGVDGSFGASFEDAIELVSGMVDVRAPLRELMRAFSSKELAEKYPARSRGVAATEA